MKSTIIKKKRRVTVMAKYTMTSVCKKHSQVSACPGPPGPRLRELLLLLTLTWQVTLVSEYEMKLCCKSCFISHLLASMFLAGQSKLAIFSAFLAIFSVLPFPFLPAVFSTFWMLFVPQALLLTNAIFRKGLRPNGASKASVALDGSCATRIHDESLFFVAGTILRDAGG